MVELSEIGKSIQNRSIILFTIHSPGAFDPNKPAVTFTANMHSREWISTMTAQWIIVQFLTEYEKNPEVKEILDKMNIFVIPMLNPDGYTYSYNINRLWRKNRNPNSGKGDYGVDLNRNFKHGYGIGASSQEFSEVYKGTAPLSEPEARAVDGHFQKYKNVMRGGVDLHSYGQLILRPYGYKYEDCPHEKELRELGAQMAEVC